MDLKTYFEIIAAILTSMALLWGFVKIAYRYKEKFIFVTNCHILPRTFWESVSNYYKINTYGDHDHAFRPLIFLPVHLKPYIKLSNNGETVLLESRVNDQDLSISCLAYWIPDDLQPWSKLNHPLISLIVRRFLQIERPLFPDEDHAPDGWHLVHHPKAQLVPLHDVDPHDSDKLLWACSNKYSFRFYNAIKGVFTDSDDKDALIEYCGLSIRLSKKSILHLNT